MDYLHECTLRKFIDNARFEEAMELAEHAKMCSRATCGRAHVTFARVHVAHRHVCTWHVGT